MKKVWHGQKNVEKDDAEKKLKRKGRGKMLKLKREYIFSNLKT
jgi:hypothetical protein